MRIYNKKILLVDDNQDLLIMIQDTLVENGYTSIVTAVTVKEAIACFEKEKPEMAILDIMLPDGDGFTLFRRLREKSDIPILFLSAKDEDNDRLFGLGLGADDYITKPFLSQELVLRVGAILKRTYAAKERADAKEEFQLGARLISLEEGVVKTGETETPFTAKEWLLLRKLYENRGRIVTFDALCRAVWDDDYYGYENTLMVHIRHLREKIEEDPSHPKWLLTARGLGYRLAK